MRDNAHNMYGKLAEQLIISNILITVSFNVKIIPVIE